MKKRCVACGKQIPAVALDCVFCSARQPVESVDDGQEANPHALEATRVGVRIADLTPEQAGMGGEIDPDLAGGPDESAPATAATAATGGAETPASLRHTGVMQALTPEQIEAAKAAQAAKPAAEAKPADAKPEPKPEAKPVEAKPVEPEPKAAETTPDTKPEAKPERRPRPERRESEGRRPGSQPRQGPPPFERAGRVVMGLSGALLLVLFLLPWHGVSSFRLLDSLVGGEFVIHLSYLTGGLVLLASALLPLPFAFRALVGAAVAATPVLAGAVGLMPGWRGVLAAIAVLGLPASHLCRAHVKSSGMARALVATVVLAIFALYLVPVASVVPLVGVIQVMLAGDIGPLLLSIFLLIPAAFALLSLLGLIGRDLTDVGVLLAVLSLLWAPLVVALRGLAMDDGTQVYVALALVGASATAAVSMAQLLSLAARRTA